MLTFALSNLVGGLLGIVPDVMKEVRDTRNHKRELEHMEKLAEIQRENSKLAHDSKMRELEANTSIEEVRATRETVSKIIESAAKPTGIVWIDAFNSLLQIGRAHV